MTVEEWLGKDNELGIDIWKRKYQHNNETFDEWLDRISANDESVKKLIAEKKFLFAGRILSNRGISESDEKTTYSNCYVVSPPNDNLESIYDTCKALARTYSYGGGCGIDISRLAPSGAKVCNQAKTTSGAVSFMDTFAQVTEQIGQHGRRGALMISMRCNHPDIEKFITIKSDLNKVNYANISVMVTDDFMQAVKGNKNWKLSFSRPETGEIIEKEVKAKDLFNLICEQNWNYAEPGILFWDTICNNNLLNNNKDFEYAGTNPCVRGDTLILTDEGYKEIESLDGIETNVWNGYEYSTVTPHLTGVNQEMMRITMSNGMSVDCTPYHKFLLDNGSRVEAKDLSIGDKFPKWEYPINPKITINPELAHCASVSKIEKAKPADKVYCMNEPKNHTFIANGIIVGNCAEEPLPAGGSCLLGSLNISAFVNNNSEFDYESFRDAVRISVKALNVVLEEGLPKHPLREQRDTVRDWMQIGLGIMGLSDALIRMGYTYGRAESIRFCDDLGQILAKTAIETSSTIASEVGSYPKYNELVLSSSFFTKHADKNLKALVKESGLRNSQILTIAPTGTISTMLGISGGIEPIFANSYTRRTQSLYGEDVEYKVYTPIVAAYMKQNGISKEEDLPSYFVTSADVTVDERIAMQSVWQRHIDASISSTVNLPESATIEDVQRIYMRAWENGLKGITVFRTGCKRAAILSDSKDKREIQSQTKDIVEETKGLEYHLTTGCGSLHVCAYFDKNGNLKNTYLSKGSSGGCNNFMISLSRMISLAAKNGASINQIVDQLSSCGTCPSYAVRRATQKDVSPGSCCPVAIGNALIKMWEYANKSSFGHKKDISTNKCPECGAELVSENGCVTCKNCGYSKCG